MKQDKEMVILKIVSEYDQEIPQSQTANNPMAPRGRATQPSRDTSDQEDKLSKATSSLFCKAINKKFHVIVNTSLKY